MNSRNWSRWKTCTPLEAFVALVAGVVVLTAAAPAVAQEASRSAGNLAFAVVVGQSRVLQVNDLVRVAVADPAVADVVVVSRTEVIVNGKSEGRTTFHVWDSSGRTSFDVRVYVDNEDLLRGIENTIGMGKVRARLAGSTLVLDGTVETGAESERAELIAKAYADKVLNLIVAKGAAAEPGSQEGTRSAIDPDVALRDAVVAAVRDPRVEVTVVKGTVLLEGEVSSDTAKLRAETVARLCAPNVVSIVRVAEPAALPASPPPLPPSPPPEPRLEDRVSEYIGVPTARVRSVGGKLLLEGSVKSQNDLERAQKIAGMFSADVVNLLEMTDPVQVLLRVQVVEVSLGALQNLGVTWGGLSGGVTEPGSFVFGEVPIPVTPPLLPSTPQAQGWQARLPLGSVVTEVWRLSPIRATLNALITQDKAKVLAQPGLLTLSGKRASFLVGGEIPIYLGRSDGKVTFEWRPYGVKLNILPTVDSRGRVVVDIEPEVSSLDWNNALDVGDAVIPALKVRRASTHLVVADGATIALGGLLQRNEVEHVKKLPALGDILGNIPIIGALFRSKKFEQGETELVIFITSNIVRTGEQVSGEMMLELAPREAR